MELAFALRELSRRKRLLALGVVVSCFVTVLLLCHVTLLPPNATPRSLQYSAATTTAIVDAPESFIGDLGEDVTPMVNRATIYANLLASPALLKIIGRYAGIPGDEIYAAGPVDPTQQRVVVEPTAGKRNYQVAHETDPYRLEFLTNTNLPAIWVYSQAPTTAQAIALANASVSALQTYIATVPGPNVQASSRVTIRQIGRATGSIVNGGIQKKLAGLIFVATFVAWCGLVLIATRFAEKWRATAPSPQPRGKTVVGATNGHRVDSGPLSHPKPASAAPAQWTKRHKVTGAARAARERVTAGDSASHDSD